MRIKGRWRSIGTVVAVEPDEGEVEDDDLTVDVTLERPTTDLRLAIVGPLPLRLPWAAEKVVEGEAKEDDGAIAFFRTACNKLSRWRA